MAWYLIVLPIALAVVLSLIIPYVRKNYIDDVTICGVCRKKYSKKSRGCPNCGVGTR